MVLKQVFVFLTSIFLLTTLFNQPVFAQVQPVSCCQPDRDSCLTPDEEIGFCVLNANNIDALSPINLNCSSNNYCFPYKDESELPCCAEGDEWKMCSGPSPLMGLCTSRDWNIFAESCTSGLVCGFLYNPNEPEDCCSTGSSQSQDCSLANGTSGYCSQLNGGGCTSGLMCRQTPDTNPNCCNPGSIERETCTKDDGSLGQCQTSSSEDGCNTSGLICQTPETRGTYSCICQSLGANGYSCTALDQCTPGSVPDYSICRDYPVGGDIPCGRVDRYCDMGSCIIPGTSGYGDTCNSGSDCTEGLVCEEIEAEKICTHPLGTISTGGQCKYNSECSTHDLETETQSYCAFRSGENSYISCEAAGYPNDCICWTELTEGPITDSINFQLCQQATTPELVSACLECNGIYSAIGCIPSNRDQLAQVLIRWGIGVGGGISLLLILLGSITTTISSGNPEKLKQGKDIITAAISGLVFIILSIAILQFIGVQILQIPGLSN